MDEAIACYRKAIELDPKDRQGPPQPGRCVLGQGPVGRGHRLLQEGHRTRPEARHRPTATWALRWGQGPVGRGHRLLHEAIELDPKLAVAHANLGNALKDTGQLDEAIACFRKAIDLDPTFADAHSNLGCDSLRHQTGLRRGHRLLRKAIELDPRTASLHYNLGNALNGKGQVGQGHRVLQEGHRTRPEIRQGPQQPGRCARRPRARSDAAIACLRKAIEARPELRRSPHQSGPLCWGPKGQVQEAIACFKKAIELGFIPARPLLARAERAAAAQDRFADFQNGRYTPAINEERLMMAEWCQVKKLNHAANGLYAAAFLADPRLADNLQAAHRCNAACFASLAAASQGVDAAKLDDQERTRLRQQALDWLRADLALRTKQLATGTPADRAGVQQQLRHWQTDTDLAGIRDAAALAKLPADEQKVLTQLWTDVAALRTRTEIPAVKAEKP